jgi:HAD superfamily hydrolase (TIGR01509 family)
MILSAVIFDLDGTILEDEDEYGRAFNKVLKTLGVETGNPLPQTRGIGVEDNWPILIKKYNITISKTPAVLAKETQEAYLSEISEITVRPGFMDFEESLRNAGVKIGLATSNSWEVTDRVLTAINLQGIFDVITTREEAAHSKPDPDLFTITSDKLGMERYECLVIEDAPSGVEAARRAGMKVVAIADKVEDETVLSKADLTVENFSEITPEKISEL